MICKDLRSFLSLLEDQGDLVHIRRLTSIEYEIAAGIRKTSDIHGPALLFDNVEGFDMPMVGGLYAHRRRALSGLATSEETFFSDYSRGIAHPKDPVMVDSAPCQEVVLTGSDADLSRIPICLHSDRDSGPFITMGLQFARDPEFGRNVSIHRMQVNDGQTCGMLFGLHQNIGMYYQRAEQRGEPLPVAVALGTDPFTALTSQVPAGIYTDELALAGGLLGEPVELVKCVSIDAEVPATSEIVLEGELVPGERRDEGPFGEFTGFYSFGGQQPIWRLKAITHRRDPIYLAGLTGMPVTDNHVMRQVNWEPVVYEKLKTIYPTIRDVCMTDGGANTLHLVVSIKPLFKGQVRDLILTAMQVDKLRPKLVTVVDEDVDPRNPLQVEWAMAMFVQADRDLIVISDTMGNALDPSNPEYRVGARLGIDATRPFGQEFPDIVEIPGAEHFDIPGWTDRPTPELVQARASRQRDTDS